MGVFVKKIDDLLSFSIDSANNLSKSLICNFIAPILTCNLHESFSFFALSSAEIPILLEQFFKIKAINNNNPNNNNNNNNNIINNINNTINNPEKHIKTEAKPHKNHPKIGKKWSKNMKILLLTAKTSQKFPKSSLLDENDQAMLEDSVRTVLKLDQFTSHSHKWEKLASVDYECPYIDEKTLKKALSDKENLLFIFAGIENDEPVKYGAFCPQRMSVVNMQAISIFGQTSQLTCLIHPQTAESFVFRLKTGSGYVEHFKTTQNKLQIFGNKPFA